MQATMLWLNGWGMSDAVWQDVLPGFPDCRHVIPDFSRHTAPEQFYETALRAVRACGSTPLFVIGWSMGGMLAQRLAVEVRIAGLVLVSTTARFVREKAEAELGWGEGHVRHMMRGLQKERDKVMERFFRSMAADGETASFADTWSVEALLAGLAYLQREDCRPLLRKIPCPTLILHGSDDVICPRAAAGELAAAIPQASLIAMPGAGHAPMATRPSVLTAEIRRVVDEWLEINGAAPVQ